MQRFDRVPIGEQDIYELMGKGAVVFHRSTHGGWLTGLPYIGQACTWFISMWGTVSYEYPV